MVGILIKVVAMSTRTNAITEQLNIFGRNLNTVSQKFDFHVISIADSDCRSKVKIGNVKGGLPLQTSTREPARWYGRRL